MQSSCLYITDGDEIDWAYGRQRIFMYTFEMYPSHAQGQLDSPASTRPTSSSRARPNRNKDAILYLIERAGCRYAIIGKTQDRTAARSSTTSRRRRGWDADPLGTDTATRGAWQRGNPAATTCQAGDGPVGLAGAGHGRGGRLDRRGRTTSMAA